MRNRPIYDVVALLARCGVGTVFIAHGWQKIQVGITATGQNLDAMGAPVPTAAAVYSTFVELLGGAALILGLALPVAGTLLFLDMAGALIFVHAKHGIFLVDNGSVHNGFELVLVLGLASLVFAAGGGGRLALDRRVFGRSPAAPDDDDEYGDPPPWRPEREHTAELPAPADRSDSAAEFPARPDEDDTTPTTRPRLAAEMVTDTSRDVIVAGKKTEPSPEAEKTARTPRKRPKSGS